MRRLHYKSDLIHIVQSLDSGGKDRKIGTPGGEEQIRGDSFDEYPRRI